jgi:hypothetical protein
MGLRRVAVASTVSVGVRVDVDDKMLLCVGRG